ncbi:arsenic resistance protein [Occultella aeris]|uniref:Sodium Bile acid symporter family protein n=1 Tax=Occultella aeris TaxID=2761496 RepID=A0A7M4DIC6_9MICO|nr:Sodium Bile acid symporter family protein [Occultella aeris]
MWTQRWQVPLYLGAIVLAGIVGLTVPAAGPPLARAIGPVLALLLYATFLGVPFAAIGAAVRDLRFLTTVLALNFVIVPAVVFGLSRFVSADAAVLLGVLLVLLTPCVDYVIVFAGIAGGARARLLAAAPLLMLGQILLLPVYLWLFVGPGTVRLIELAPFGEAFGFLIVIPLAAAGLTQWWARHRQAGRVLEGTALGLMVPLMMLTLAVVVASQVAGIGSQLSTLLLVVPIYVAFLVVMVPLGILAARVARLDIPAARAVVFSGATRNSLVVLPLALALPEPLALAALVVVTQTLVELVGMVVYVRLIPRLMPAPAVRESDATYTRRNHEPKSTSDPL